MDGVPWTLVKLRFTIRPRIEAIEAALERAERPTLLGSTTPIAMISSYAFACVLWPSPLGEAVYVVHDDGAFIAGVDDDLAQRLLQGAADYLVADLIVIVGPDVVEGHDAADQANTDTGGAGDLRRPSGINPANELREVVRPIDR